jgi:integrase/recombinase XerD
MPNSQNSSTRAKCTMFIDYKPAELRENKDWMIVYYAKNPVTQKLDMQRLRVPTMASKTERLKHAKRIVAEINNKLYNGWSPFFEQTGKNYKSFEDAVTEFLKYLNKQVKEKVFRADTLRTYNSNMNLVKQFITEKNLSIKFALELTKHFVVQYLDWIYIERGNSPRTRNNHLAFMKLFCSYLVNRGALAENSVMGILPLKTPSKKREVFPPEIKEKIQKELAMHTGGFNALCLMTYFCFVRNMELGKMKVNMINLKENYIFLPKEISKNKKDEFVTIPTQYLPVITKHIKNADASHYLFSSDDFKTGSKQMPVRKIATAWEKIRENLKLESKYQFYSLKDTGITDLLNSGVPAIKVRDQARHYDIKITEIYTPRSKGCDETIQNANISFS